MLQLDPFVDSRWSRLIELHPHASVYQSIPWLKTLRDTYGYEPFVITTCPPGVALTNGIVVCPVKSPITGHRLVSLPFSDHCEPLLDRPDRFVVLENGLRTLRDNTHSKYVELRPQHSHDSSRFGKSARYFLHKLFLNSDLDNIFQRFHPSCIQRQIRRAECHNMVYSASRSDTALAEFYGLHIDTRARHGLPPQPLRWFRALRDSFRDQLTVHTLSHDAVPVASVLTLRHRDTLVYKYAASDIRHHALGATVLLIWNIIQGAKQANVFEFDMGRTDIRDAGLIRFKDRWGAERTELAYSRYPESAAHSTMGHQSLSTSVPFLAHAPRAFLKALGSIAYKHLG